MPLNRIAADHSPLNSAVLAYKLNHFSVHIKPDDFIFFKGINALINSFRNGFNMSFDINKMQCFTSQEIEENICGSKEIKWKINNLYENINKEHSYKKQRKIINNVII